MENRKKGQQPNINVMVKISLLAAISAILMIFEFPLPFAPGFYKLDFSEVPVLLGALILGPWSGVLIELLKILLNLVINGTITGGVGEFANFVIGCSLVVPIAFIYRKQPTKRGLLLGIIVGIATLTIVGALLNYYVLLPLFAKVFNLPLMAFVDMGRALNPMIVDVKALVLWAVVPFNFFKGVLVSFVTVLLFNRIKGAL